MTQPIQILIQRVLQLGNLPCIIKDEQKFITAGSAAKFTKGFHLNLRYKTDNLVAYLVAVCVVNVTEIIQIQADKNKRFVTITTDIKLFHNGFVIPQL